MFDEEEKRAMSLAELMTLLATRLIMSSVLVGLALKYGPAWAVLFAVIMSIIWAPAR